MSEPIRNSIDGGVFGGPVIQARTVNVTRFGGEPAHQGRWPKQVGAVPEVADAYRPRSPDLDSVGAAAVVLAGMPGSGKTQLAAHYAHGQLRRQRVDLVLWVSVTSRAAVEQAYTQAAVELGLSQPANAESLLAWLRTADRRWLVVLDDVLDPADLRALWPPANRLGHTVVTTRRRDPSLRTADRRIVEVEPFGEADSVAYLADRLTPHGLDEPAGRLAELAADLGHLPLALAQASAHLIDRSDSGVTVAGYRARLAEHRPLAELAPDRAALPDGQERSLAEILAEALSRADAATGSLATPVLQLASVLHPDGVPVDVLTSEPARLYCADATAEAVHETLRTLHRLSLVTRTNDLLRVHRLVQWAAHDSVPSAARRAQLVELAALALTTAWTTGPLDRETVRIRRANHRALAARHPEVSGGTSSDTLAMLEQAAALLETAATAP